MFCFVFAVVAELVASFGRFVHVDNEILRWFVLCRWLSFLRSVVVERLSR